MLIFLFYLRFDPPGTALCNTYLTFFVPYLCRLFIFMGH